MTKFGDWIRGQGNALLFDNGLANLAAQIEEALAGLSLTHEHVLRGDAREQVRVALAACKEFMEKWS